MEEEMMFEGAARARLMVVAGVMLLAATACSTSKQSDASGELTTPRNAGATKATLTFSQSGCAYEGPATMPAGPVTIDVVNTTQGEDSPVVLYAALLLVHEGHTHGDLVNWISGPKAGSPPPWVTTVVDGETGPGEDDELSATVTAGTYGVICATPHDPESSILSAGSFAVTG
jgi:hypothetical protein